MVTWELQLNYTSVPRKSAHKEHPDGEIPCQKNCGKIKWVIIDGERLNKFKFANYNFTI